MFDIKKKKINFYKVELFGIKEDGKILSLYNAI